ncbi:MAG: hypothetical protein FWF83_05635 [Clostridiales bacterium]|nr:hypothetical protein [Clostridiales bacterium]
MAKYSHRPSWTAIIIWMVIFWPIGLALFMKKLTSDRVAAVRKDRKAPMTGWLLLVLGLYFLGSRSFGGAFLVNGLRSGPTLAIFFLVGGAILLSAAKKGNENGEKYRDYIDAIVNHGLVSIRDIAAFAEQKESVVYKDLKKMIKMGYFDRAYLDGKRGEIWIYQRRAQGDRWDWDGGGANAGKGMGAGDGASVNRGMGRSRGTGAGTGAGAGVGTGAGASAGTGAGAGVGTGAGTGAGAGAGTGTGTGAGAGTGVGTSSSMNASGVSGEIEVIVTCKNCGAQNWVTQGSRNVCEFCGSPISGE